MLTIKQILDNKEAVIRGLEKKHFANAEEAVNRVLEINNERKAAQAELDNLLAQVKNLSKSIGALMKEGNKDEAEAAKQQVADIKEQSKSLEVKMAEAAEQLKQQLYTIPNLPYDEVPEGRTAEENVVVLQNRLQSHNMMLQ